MGATGTEQGPALFSALDVSGDGRLSLREMRNAETVLAAFDKNGDKMINPEEMPGTIGLAFSRGFGGYYGVGVRLAVNGGGMGIAAPARSAPPLGPAWFVRMDRNGDGDVTLREFFGTPEQFAEIDADGDGLIDPAEAEAASKRAK